MKRMICLALTLMLVVVSIPNNALATEEVIADDEVIIEEPAEENAVEEYAESAENEIVSEMIEDPVEEVEFELGGEADIMELPIDEASEPIEEEIAVMKASSSSGFVIENGVLVKYTGSGWDIVIPNSVTSIANNAFSNCRSEKNMILAGANAAIGLINLTSVTIPSSVSYIPQNAFSTCNKAEFIVEKGSYAEQYCINAGLSYSTTNESGNIINNDQCGDNVFWNLNEDKTLVIRGTGTMWNYTNEIMSPWSKYYEAETGEILINKVIIESGVTSIGNWAFYDCDASEFQIADTVKEIGEGAFSGCLNLNYIALPDGLTTIQESTFFESGIESIKWPKSLKTIGKYAFGYLSYFKVASFTEGLKTIDENAFFESNIEEIYIPASVELIEKNAFSRCDRIKTIQVDNQNNYYRAVDNTLYLKEMDFLVLCATAKTGEFIVPLSVRYIGAYAFECSHYSTILLPDGLKGIGKLAFHGCFELRTINIPSSVIAIDNDSFLGWSPDGSELVDLTAIVVPNSYGENYFKKIGLKYICQNLPRFPFMKGLDNWSFVNSNAYFGPDSENYYLQTSTRNKILGNLRPEVKKYLSFEMDQKWGGSCYGMVALAALIKQGIVSPTSIQSGKTSLYSITKKNNDDVESIINYYHFMQFLPKAKNENTKMVLSSRRFQLNSIIAAAQMWQETRKPFVIAFYTASSGHIVLGCGYERGDFTYEGTKYSIKIPVYDPNCPNYESALYCNTNNEIFELTYDGGHYRILNFGIVTNREDILNLPYDNDKTSYLYSELILKNVENEYSISINGIDIPIDGYLEDKNVGIVSYPDISGDSNNYNIMFMNERRDFSVASKKIMDFMYSFDEAVYTIENLKAENVAFTKTNCLAVKEAVGEYEISLIQDDDLGTPWTETLVSSKDTDIAINPTKDGLIISGDNLKNVTVTACNDKGETEIQLDTQQTSVLVTGNNSTGNKPAPTVYEDTNGDGVYETPVAGPEVVSLNGSSLKKTVKIGDEFQIDVPDLSIKSCKSSKTKVAAVSDGGYVVAKGEGSAKITVTLTNKKKRTLSLTVVDPYKPSGISLAQGKTATLSMEDTLKLSATLSPATARTTLTWKSSKTKIAKVDSSGVVTPVAEGKAKITVTTTNKKKAEITVTVVDPYKPSSVSISEGKIAVLNMGDTVQLNAVLAPATARSTLTWKSSKTKIATVDSNGIVTPKAEGTAKITVTTGNKKTATINVHVVDPYKPTGVLLNQTGTVKIGVGQTLQLYAELSPDTARTTLTWSSSAKKYATVTNTGLVTGVKKGSAKITVKTANGKKATVKITVDNSVIPTDNWLSNFEPGKSGVSVYSSATDKSFHSKTSCVKAIGAQVKYTLENALNGGKEPCPTCMEHATVKVYVTKDDPYYHTDKSHAKSGAISTNVAKAKAYGLVACPTCSGEGNEVIDGNSDSESIRYIQEMLRKVGLLSQADVNGVYGSSTKSAVKKFQQWVNTKRKEQTVEVTGIADNLTRLYLEYCVNNGMTVS